jgi:5-bromo-4-chloroindolyl phosphate hydrolysis protein
MSATHNLTADEVALTRAEYENIRDRLAHAEQYAAEALKAVHEINRLTTWNVTGRTKTSRCSSGAAHH